VNPWEKGISCLTIALIAAILVKLWYTHLIKAYTLLFCYLAFDCVWSVAALLIPYRTKYYAHFYFSGQTISIVIAALMLVEIYWLALESTPALAAFLRSAVGYILGAATLIPIVGLWADHSASARIHPFMRADLLFEQTLDATMAIFLIIISIFMAWFPVRLRRNVIVYITGFIAWSLSRSAAVHLARQFHGNTRITLVINVSQMCTALACLSLWLIGLQREGESRTAVVGHLSNRADAGRLIQQLDAINDSIARMRRSHNP
jgi:hypothetical protein